MGKKKWICALALGLTGSLQSGAALAQAPAKAVVPIEAFFQPASLAGAKLSPSGRWLAAIGNSKVGDRKQLIVLDLQNQAPPQVIALFETVDVSSVEWMTEETLIFWVTDTEDAESHRKGEGMFSVGRDGKDQRLLVKRNWDTDFAARGAQPLEANHQLIGYGPEGSNEIIVGEYHYTGRELSHVTPHLFNVTTRAKRLLTTEAPPHKKVSGWRFDHLGRARVASVVDDGQVIYFYRDAQQGPWREIGRFGYLNAAFQPAFVDGDDRLFVYAVDKDGNYTELREFDFEKGKAKAEPLLTTPGFDTSAQRVMDRRNGRTLAYQVTLDDTETVWLNPTMKAFQQQVDKLLPGRVNTLSCRGCDAAESVLVYSYSDRHPGEYLHYNGKTKAWQRLGSVKSDIDERRMGTTELLRIKARDGQEFPVWVTRPADAKPNAALPTIVMVHGGPWVRGRSWGFESESQFLASRGYLVIEPEFRGSTGFGDKLYRAGFKQWGLSMQDDLADALKFAVDKGWADPKRACIAGASYGGYAALMGVAKQSDLFRCAVSWVGVTDPRLMFSVHWSDVGNDTKKHSMPEMIGDPVKDQALLAANAPVELAAKIKTPVLLAYGHRDRRVPLIHGDKMREALIAAANKPEWIVYDDEGHGWRRPKNQIDFWTRVEKFLAKSLQP